MNKADPVQNTQALMQGEPPAYRRREGQPPQQLNCPRKTAQEACWSEPCVPTEMLVDPLGVGGERTQSTVGLEGAQRAGLRCRAVTVVI